MKKIIIVFIFLFVKSISFSQESKGYVLDGTYMIGHIPYGNFIDTLNQAYTVANAAKAIKFRNVVDSIAVSVNQDSIIKVYYSGIYKIDVEFRLDNPMAGYEFGTYGIISNWINLVDGSRLNNTAVSHIQLNYPDIQTYRFSQLLRLQNNDEFKVMISMDNTSISLTTTGPEMNPPRPQQPSARLIITKISDL